MTGGLVMLTLHVLTFILNLGESACQPPTPPLFLPPWSTCMSSLVILWGQKPSLSQFHYIFGSNIPWVVPTPLF